MKKISDITTAEEEDQNYWKENYSDPSSMDGIVNANLHARYLKSFFMLEDIEVNSIIDFGFGLGFLFERVIKEFEKENSPLKKIIGIEPSNYAFTKVTDKKFFKSRKDIDLQSLSVEQWCLNTQNKNKINEPFDLGLFTSVLQYIPTSDLELVIKTLASNVKYLYLSVPTDKELDHQIEYFQFFDRFALRRTQEFYRNLISKHFTFISARILESKNYFTYPHNVHFTEHLFRF
jgi:hypothetical protein